MDIDKDDSKHSRRSNNGGENIEEVINLDSDEDEDINNSVIHNPEGKASHAMRALSGGHLHMEQPESANKNSPLTPLWNYVDPQGNTRGPFPLMSLFRWRGFFDKNFKVWRTGETVEQAILLTDAFVMDL
ncbi:hypothetical protein HU200_065218 [Digitaria exilis]|uniref:GYF domain-containing protein n=1 Tax=Digitaria exilis TaxID=1010633 RepID=A0A835DUR1_9POAL|nr:hypothetical protein HU200_065218 [Digitaria exilis]